MRKYVKPVLFYEHYELSQHIADCAWELKNSNGTPTLEADGSCVAYGDSAMGIEGTLFTDTIGCTETNREDYCYQPGAGGLKLFRS